MLLVDIAAEKVDLLGLPRASVWTKTCNNLPTNEPFTRKIKRYMVDHSYKVSRIFIRNKKSSAHYRNRLRVGVKDGPGACKCYPWLMRVNREICALTVFKMSQWLRLANERATNSQLGSNRCICNQVVHTIAGFS